MSRPRILYVSQATQTGLARYVVSVAAAVQAAGCDVLVVSPPANDLRRWCVDLGIPWKEWAAERQPGPSMVGEIRRLRRIVRDFRPDAVHLASSKAGLVGRLAIRRSVPTIFSPEAWSFLVPGRQSDVALRWERFAARWTDLIITGCEEEAQVGRDHGIDVPYAVSEHGIDPDRFHFADAADQASARDALGLPDRPIVLCIGRLCHQKGQESLLDAWPAVVTRVPDAMLLLVGPADPGEDERLGAKAGPSVRFVGQRDDVETWLSAADVVAQPSRYEALSFSVLEAMGVGRSVVAYDGIGMKTAIADEAGAVVPMDDHEALADALSERLLDRERCRIEGKAGRQRVETRFTVERLQSQAVEHTLALLARTSA